MNSRSKKNYFQEEILDPCIHLENRVRKKLIRRYEKPLSYHDVKMINDIIYNEKTHYVELFKEYLIYEDINEFLKRFYNINEISIKLPRILLFYEKYSKIYANYTVIPESKYMYKNIKRKQKMIDQMQNNNDDNDDEEEEEEGEDLPNIILNTKAMNSINSFTMSIFGNDSISKNSKTETSVNNLLNKINNYERNAQKIKVRNKNNRKSNTNNLNKNKLTHNNIGRGNNHLIQKKTVIQLGDSISRKIFSVIFSPNTKLINNHKKKVKNKNVCSQNKKGKKILKDNIKDNKIIMSTMTAISPKISPSRVFSPSGPSSNKNILNKKKYISPTISNNNSRREKNTRKIFSNPLSKKPETQRDYYSSKLFSNKNELFKKKKNTIIKSNNKSKSNSKNKENNSIINNYNIINNFQSGSTQINIYTGNELINSLHLHANSVFNSSTFNNRTSKSPIHRKNNSNNMTYNYKQKSISKPKKQKFDLNLRKIIHKHIIDNESSTERNNKNFFDKLGNYFLTKNSKKDYNSITKCSINESKLISKIINTNPQNRRINKYKSKEKNINYTTVKTSIQNNSLLNSNSNFKVKKIKSISLKDKFKLNGLNDLNKLYKKYVNSKGYSSERNNKTKNKIK